MFYYRSGLVIVSYPLSPIEVFIFLQAKKPRLRRDLINASWTCGRKQWGQIKHISPVVGDYNWKLDVRTSSWFLVLLKSPSLLFAVAKLGELSVQRKALRPVDCRPASWLPSEKASTSFDPNSCSSGFDVRWVTCDLCRKFASWCVDCLSRSFQNL